MSTLLRRWLIAGMLVWLPLGATLLVIRFVINLLDISLLLIPESYRPEIPGLGVLLSVLLVLGTGAIAANYIGSKLVVWTEAMLSRIPLVRTVYGGIKKLAETIFSEKSVSFRQPILIEYPRKGLWSVAFVTGDPIGEVQDKTAEHVLTCFVPTTPNPTSGFIVLVPDRDIIRLDMSVEAAMRLVISLGVVTPEDVARRGVRVVPGADPASEI
ncbi:DUF502 domain-containing protein [Sinimarinibacterium sp. CAU 1509]|uniref:DUF502 domain-containing protein n=1 Tax=Sinimarinibacterium sp. CAU 1509 TaxID=2562283 RepID=UPI0010ACEBA4|nr:DUF502 domain-containing protein [Sinimarinibacterium sp. CAU 1509]TJY60880.1 DUF502 domain-containing protein [Sinimarinibacterium sp. CAU 1509]